MNILAWTAFLCAIEAATLFVWNMFLYREPPIAITAAELNAVSVLIPARNESASIAGCVESVMASRGLQFEVIVLDDGSSDSTAEIVQELMILHPNLRIEAAPALPHGWNGKQHACYVLSKLARHEILCFIDADVRLAPGALARMSAFLDRSHSQLVSGIPHQETKTFLEVLLLPLIHFVLLAYLPIAGMRRFRSAGFGAGCGQFLMMRRKAYDATGGHSSIRETMHDGLLLPQLFRRSGFHADIADMTSLATCRMYSDAGEVWRGLMKNATEGMAAPARILPFTLLLFFGQILPLLLVFLLLNTRADISPRLHPLIFIAVTASYLPRLVAVWRYRQSLYSALLHPFGVAVLVVLQWCALVRKFAGQPATWKDRAYPVR